MTIGMLFWILMILAFLSWGGVWFIADARFGYVNNVVVWVCLALLGWHVFGAAIHG